MAIKLCNATARDMYLINDFAKVELQPEDVFVFEFELCDTKVDKNNEIIMPSAIRQLKEQYIGRRGFINNFKVRPMIFDTWIETDIDKTCLHLKAKAYFPHNEFSKELGYWMIDKTIEKEISIAFSSYSTVCSICGQSECGHTKGQYYHDVRCMRKIKEITDVYEWSIHEPLFKNESENVRTNINKGLEPVSDQKDWTEFRKTGLLCLVNNILHRFGWTIYCDIRDNKVVSAFPTRVKFRDFLKEINTKGYTDVNKYLKDNIEELFNECEGE